MKLWHILAASMMSLLIVREARVAWDVHRRIEDRRVAWMISPGTSETRPPCGSVKPVLLLRRWHGANTADIPTSAPVQFVEIASAHFTIAAVPVNVARSAIASDTNAIARRHQ